MIGPEAALIICRSLFDGAAIALWGASSFLAVLVPGALARHLSKRLLVSDVIAITVVVAMTALLLPLKAATIDDGWIDAIDVRTILAVLFEMNVGTAWQAQALAATLVSTSMAVPARRRQGALALSSGLLLATQAVIGHASTDEEWMESAQRLNDAARLWSGGAWLEALLPVLMLTRLLKDNNFGAAAQIVLIRFSTVGLAAVAIAIATGIMNTLMTVGSPFRTGRSSTSFRVHQDRSGRRHGFGVGRQPVSLRAEQVKIQAWARSDSCTSDDR